MLVWMMVALKPLLVRTDAMALKLTLKVLLL
jgi:hypothetical protein